MGECTAVDLAGVGTSPKFSRACARRNVGRHDWHIIRYADGGTLVCHDMHDAFVVASFHCSHRHLELDADARHGLCRLDVARWINCASGSERSCRRFQ